MKNDPSIALCTPSWLSLAETNALAGFVREVQKSSLVIDQLWLYGSRARGQSHTQSDLDVAVVCANTPDNAREILHSAAWNAGLGSDGPPIEACVTGPISDPKSTLYLARSDAIRLI